MWVLGSNPEQEHSRMAERVEGVVEGLSYVGLNLTFLLEYDLFYRLCCLHLFDLAYSHEA